MQHDITPRARATRAKGGPLFCSLVMKKIQRHIIRVFVSRSTSNYDMPDKLNHVKRYLFMSNVKERASGGGPPNLIIIIKLSNMENKKKIWAWGGLCAVHNTPSPPEILEYSFPYQHETNDN